MGCRIAGESRPVVTLTSIWTPRPPAEDEPACWSWLVPPVLTVEERRILFEAEQALVTDHNEVRSWSGVLLALEGKDPRFEEFHLDRCAMCGKHLPWVGQTRRPLVDDHCHGTGQIRGLLCKSCNSREGRTIANTGVIGRYRAWHPAAILDTHDMYDGYGWEWGWPPGQVPRDRSERPATPWPACDLGMLG